MLGVLEYDITTDVASFAVDTEADLTLLPNLTDFGQDNLVNMDPVKMGSTAITIDTSEVYMLGSNNTWEKL